MQELEMDWEMYPVEPVEDAEHPTIEMDPVADFENARAAMEAQIRQLNEELEKTKDARMAEKQERDLLKLQVDTMRKEREKADENLALAADKIYALRRQKDNLIDSHEREMEDVRRQMNKPILWPFLAVVGFVILALLVGMAVDHALVAYRLGEPLAYGCICVVALFVGIIWERLGGGICGRKRVCNAKLGAGRDCRSGRNCG